MLICGFRGYEVGVDTHNYVEFVSFEENINRLGPVYVLLRTIAKVFYNEGTAFLVLMALMTYIPLSLIVKRHSYYPALSVLMYIIPVGNYFVQTLNIARQSIAIIFVLYAALYIKEHKEKTALIILVFCFLLHPFTFPALILLFINKIKFTRTIIMVLVGGSMFIGLAGTLSGISEILNLMMVMTSDSSNPLIAKLGKYGNYEVVSHFSVIGQLSHMLPLATMCILGIDKRTLGDIFYKMMVLGCVATNIFVSVIFCERIASTFTIAQILAVPYIYKISNGKKRIMIFLLLVLTTLLFIYNFNSDTKLDMWTPYYSIFD